MIKALVNLTDAGRASSIEYTFQDGAVAVPASNITTIIRFHYVWNASRIQENSVFRGNQSEVTFRNFFDPKNQLVARICTVGPFETEIFGYQENGYRLFDANNQYAFDGLERLVRTPRTDSDKSYYIFRSGKLAAKVTPSVVLLLSFAPSSNLKKVHVLNATTSQTIDVVEYEYDASGMLSRRQSLKEGETTFVFNPVRGNLEQIHRPNGRVCRFLRRADGGLMFLQTQEGLFLVIVDARGPCGLISMDGALADFAVYSAFGMRIQGGELLGECLIGFEGMITDPTTTFLHAGYRFYDPEMGIFLSPDSEFGSVGDPLSVNIHIFARNNPAAFRDPSGRLPLVINQWMMIGGVAAQYAMDVMTNMQENDWKFKAAVLKPRYEDGQWANYIAAAISPEKVAIKMAFAAKAAVKAAVPAVVSAAVASFQVLVDRQDDNFASAAVRVGAAVAGTAAGEYLCGPLLKSLGPAVSKATSPLKEFGQTLKKSLGPKISKAASRFGQTLYSDLAASLYWKPYDELSTRLSKKLADPGGIFFVTASRFFTNLSDWTSASFDPDTHELRIIGPSQTIRQGEEISPEYAYLALEALRNGSVPGVSIDPCGYDNKNCVRYFGLVDGTAMGNLFYELDRYLKTWMQCDDNLLPGRFKAPPIPGFRCLLDLVEQYDSNYVCQGSISYRMWFEPKRISLVEDGDNIRFEEASLQLLYEVKVNDVVSPSAAASTFVNFVNAHFTEFVDLYPGFKQLQQFAKVVGLVNWLHDSQKPVDWSFLNGFEAVRSAPCYVHANGRYNEAGKCVHIQFPRWGIVPKAK